MVIDVYDIVVIRINASITATHWFLLSDTGGTLHNYIDDASPNSINMKYPDGTYTYSSNASGTVLQLLSLPSGLNVFGTSLTLTLSTSQ